MLPLQHIVIDKNGVRGVTIDDQGQLSCQADPDKNLVVFEGRTWGEGDISDEDLTIVGPENAVADLVKCGAGLGEKCCMFLAVGSQGVLCGRFSSLRYSIIFSDMIAKGEPRRMFPEGQTEISGGIGGP